MWTGCSGLEVGGRVKLLLVQYREHTIFQANLVMDHIYEFPLRSGLSQLKRKTGREHGLPNSVDNGGYMTFIILRMFVFFKEITCYQPFFSKDNQLARKAMSTNRGSRFEASGTSS